ncbi:putative uncharacterized protein DDB_G0290521 [Osmerus eperlanus]|uniref:putative uncharacterized protein DDB_G0290521 n=1 Tax=Osmerus eperlanus TaxID=29151 RepID=UPI002E13EFDE
MVHFDLKHPLRNLTCRNSFWIQANKMKLLKEMWKSVSTNMEGTFPQLIGVAMVLAPRNPPQSMSSMPGVVPQAAPTRLPLTTPTRLPLTTPTRLPLTTPTRLPSTTPTRLPLTTPTRLPSTTSTGLPLTTPTGLASTTPTGLPLTTPTGLASTTPTGLPSKALTRLPSTTPTRLPSKAPTRLPLIIPQMASKGRLGYEPQPPTQAKPQGHKRRSGRRLKLSEMDLSRETYQHPILSSFGGTTLPDCSSKPLTLVGQKIFPLLPEIQQRGDFK